MKQRVIYFIKLVIVQAVDVISVNIPLTIPSKNRNFRQTSRNLLDAMAQWPVAVLFFNTLQIVDSLISVKRPQNNVKSPVFAGLLPGHFLAIPCHPFTKNVPPFN